MGPFMTPMGPFGSRIRRGGEGRGGILTEGREGEIF